MFLEQTVTSKAYRHSLTFEEKEETNFEKKRKNGKLHCFLFGQRIFLLFSHGRLQREGQKRDRCGNIADHRYTLPSVFRSFLYDCVVLGLSLTPQLATSILRQHLRMRRRRMGSDEKRFSVPKFHFCFTKKEKEKLSVLYLQRRNLFSPFSFAR